MTTALIVLSIISLVAIVALLITLKNKINDTAKYSALEERSNALSSQADLLQSKIEQLQTENSELTANISDLQARALKAELNADNLSRQIALNEAIHEESIRKSNELHNDIVKKAEANFKLLANELMQKHSEQLSENNESRLGALLKPLKENIEQFRRDINECYSNEARERFSLQNHIKELIETNNSIGREAKELTNALKGNSKTQGDWGEFVLENILETSGLRKGIEFKVQSTTDDTGVTTRDENGRHIRPDVIVNYPDGRVIVIDSKVSLTAFVEYINADDEPTRELNAKRHIASIIKHINELHDKNYQAYIGKDKLDFVMMFIPNESAYSAAMTIDPLIWEKAFEKHVLMVSPTMLVATLRMVHQLWLHDRQTKNAIDIANKSGAMYDKLVAFVDDMSKIEKNILDAHSAYNNAINKLRTGKGNLISRAESLRELGIKTTKRMKSTMLDATEDLPDEPTVQSLSE